MAEAKLVSRNGEIFTVKNENDGASSKTMKDLISSVRHVQSKINEKLTEFVNDEKDIANGNMKDSKENSEGKYRFNTFAEFMFESSLRGLFYLHLMKI